MIWFAFVAVFSVCVASASPPDRLDSTTVAGPGLLLQGVRARRHFAKPPTLGEEFFSRARRGEPVYADPKREAGAPRVRPSGLAARTEPSELAWDLAYAYAHPMGLGSVAGRSAHRHFVAAGLHWQGYPAFGLGMTLGISLVPGQDYRSGQVGFRFEYLSGFPLGGGWGGVASKGGSFESDERKQDEGYDEMDARAYFRRRTQAQASAVPVRPKPRIDGSSVRKFDDEDGEPAAFPPAEPVVATFPRLRSALRLEFDRHERTQEGGLPALSQFAAGPDFELEWSERIRFRLGGVAYGYPGSATSFVSGLSLPSGSAFVLPSRSAPAIVPQALKLLSFPRFVFEEGGSFEVSRQLALELNLNQVFSALDSIGPAFGFAPQAKVSFEERWEIGIGGDLILGGAATGVLGLVNFLYKI